MVLNKKIKLNTIHNIKHTIINSHTEAMELIKLSKPELLIKCTELGFTKCKSKNKTQMIELINSKNTQVKNINEEPKIVNVIIEEESILSDEKVSDNIVILNNDCVNHYVFYKHYKDK